MIQTHPNNNTPLTFPVDMLYPDNALEQAQIAARCLLESYVATVTLACRADLSITTREKLDRGALQARRRGLTIAGSLHVRAHYQIDEEHLRLSSIAIARFRGRGEQCQAREFTSRAVDGAIISNYAIRRSGRGLFNYESKGLTNNPGSSTHKRPLAA